MCYLSLTLSMESVETVVASAVSSCLTLYSIMLVWFAIALPLSYFWPYLWHGSRDGSFGLVHHFGPDGNISTAIG